MRSDMCLDLPCVLRLLPSDRTWIRRRDVYVLPARTEASKPNKSNVTSSISGRAQLLCDTTEGRVVSWELHAVFVLSTGVLCILTCILLCMCDAIL